MQVDAEIDFVRADPFIKGTIHYNNNSDVIDFSVNADGKHENNNNNVHLKASFNKKNEAKKSVTFKIPTKQVTDNFHYLVSAVTSACRQVFPNEFTNIINDNITINYTALTLDEQVQKTQQEKDLKMLNKLDDVEFIFEEEPNINSIPQNSEIINNDIQLQQGKNDIEELNINNEGSRNLNNDININEININNNDNNNNNIADVDKSEENNNGILPECCNRCITGLQNLWNTIKCW